MKMLAFDTSTSACSVALQNDDQLYLLHQIVPMQQASLILSLIQDLLTASSLKLQDLDAIAYGCGPGRFTGIRIASSVAQGLGFALQKPIIPISSLATLAASVFLEQQSSPPNTLKTTFLVAVNAHMNQVYWAVYEANQQDMIELVGQEIIIQPNQIKIPEKDNSDKMCKIGDGWERYSEIISLGLGNHNDITSRTTSLPKADALLFLAKPKFERGEWVAASQALPVYLMQDREKYTI